MAYGTIFQFVQKCNSAYVVVRSCVLIWILSFSRFPVFQFFGFHKKSWEKFLRFCLCVASLFVCRSLSSIFDFRFSVFSVVTFHCSVSVFSFLTVSLRVQVFEFSSFPISLSIDDCGNCKLNTEHCAALRFFFVFGFKRIRPGGRLRPGG